MKLTTCDGAAIVCSLAQDKEIAEEVRRGAFRALGQHPSSRGRELAIAVTQDTDESPMILLSAVLSLPRELTPQEQWAVSRLLQAHQSEDLDAACAIRLGSNPDPDCEKVLEETLALYSDPDTKVAVSALGSLLKIAANATTESQLSAIKKVTKRLRLDLDVQRHFTDGVRAFYKRTVKTDDVSILSHAIEKDDFHFHRFYSLASDIPSLAIDEAYARALSKADDKNKASRIVTLLSSRLHDRTRPAIVAALFSSFSAARDAAEKIIRANTDEETIDFVGRAILFHSRALLKRVSAGHTISPEAEHRLCAACELLPNWKRDEGTEEVIRELLFSKDEALIRAGLTAAKGMFSSAISERQVEIFSDRKRPHETRIAAAISMRGTLAGAAQQALLREIESTPAELNAQRRKHMVKACAASLVATGDNALILSLIAIHDGTSSGSLGKSQRWGDVKEVIREVLADHRGNPTVSQFFQRRKPFG